MLDLNDPQLLQAILDNLQIGLYVSDRAGRIVFWNDGAERITGYTRHTVLGHICGEAQSPEAAAEDLPVLRQPAKRD